MIWTLIFVGATLLISILTNVISTWVEPKLKKVKFTTVFILVSLSLLSGLYLDKKDISLPFKKNIIATESTSKSKSNIVVDQDGNEYLTFKFNNKTWLATNLKTETEDSYCYNKENSNCEQYGRLYSYNSSLKACNKLGKNWRLANVSDMKDILLANKGGYKIAKKAWGNLETVGNPLQAQQNMSLGGFTGYNATNGGWLLKTNTLIGIPITTSLGIGLTGHYWLSPGIGDAPQPYIYTLQNSELSCHVVGWANVFYSCRCVQDSL